MGNAFLAPQATDYFDRFDKPAETMFPVHAHGLKFFGPVSEASSKDTRGVRRRDQGRRHRGAVNPSNFQRPLHRSSGCCLQVAEGVELGYRLYHGAKLEEGALPTVLVFHHGNAELASEQHAIERLYDDLAARYTVR